ncbi:MAG TPA: glycosyltransferase family 39 protein [Clostridia bacterium]|nr:glycosyltransferase family 39 protein [Clostridia bacterium]
MEGKFKALLGSRKLQFILFLLTFFLGFGLRLWKYPFYPLTANAEEYIFVWQGLSLLEKGVPITWSDLPVYPKENIFWEGVAKNPTQKGELGVRLISPWLDQPPLFSLLVGSFYKLYRPENFTIISTYITRAPMLAISFFSLLFVYLLAKKLFGYWLGILSLLVYGTVPIMVFGSRLVVPENLIALGYLGVLFLLLSYFETQKGWQRDLAILLAGITGLFKPTGFLLVPFLAFWLWKKKSWKEGILAGVIGAILFFVPYFWYGFYFGKELFLRVLEYQSLRPAGWSSLTYFIANPGFSVEVFLDGFLVIGFFSLVYLIFKKRDEGEELILFSFVFTILTVIISGGRHDQLTWYRYPVYPFMSIAIALLVKDLVFNPSFVKSAIFIPLFMANADLLENPFWRVNFFINVKFYRLAFFVLLLPSILAILYKKKILVKFSRWAIIIAFAFGVFFNTWVIKGRFNLLCDHTDQCALPAKVNLLQPFIRVNK